MDLFNALAKTMIDSNDANNNTSNDADWEFSYFCLLCFEKLYKVCPKKLHPSISPNKGNNDLKINVWTIILKGLVHNHPWISLVSSRIIQFHVSLFSPINLQLKTEDVNSIFSCFVKALPGSIYEIARNTCYQLNTNNEAVLNQK